MDCLLFVVGCVLLGVRCLMLVDIRWLIFVIGCLLCDVCCCLCLLSVAACCLLLYVVCCVLFGAGCMYIACWSLLFDVVRLVLLVFFVAVVVGCVSVFCVRGFYCRWFCIVACVL